MRDRTERPEAVETGVERLVVTNIDKIVEGTFYLLNDKEAYEKMSKASNPYGDGKAAERIVNILEKVVP